MATAAKTSAKSKPRSKPVSAKSPSAKLPKAKPAKAKSASAKPPSTKTPVAKAAPDSVDYLLKQVLASGTSTRHVKSLADEVVRFAKKAGMFPLGVEGQREAEWVLVDLGDIIVHVMLPRIREFYGLERLWTVGDDMPMAANAD